MENTSLAGPPLRWQQSDIDNAMARPSPEYIDFTGDDDGPKVSPRMISWSAEDHNDTLDV
jgi:hypothetical protein